MNQAVAKRSECGKIKLLTQPIVLIVYEIEKWQANIAPKSLLFCYKKGAILTPFLDNILK